MTAVVFLLLLAQDLPQGPGKQLVENVCGSCHGLDFVLSEHASRQRWTGIVNDMVSRGAMLKDDELRTVVDYLAKNFPAEKVNVNKAGAQEIESALELSSKEAATIVQFRKDNGNFKDWPSLTKVPGVDPKSLEGKSDRVVFN